MTDKIQIGTRVRCTNTSSFNGREGTVIDLNENTYGEPSYAIDWDGSEGAARNLNGGWWGEGAFEVIEEDEDDPIEVLIEFYEEIIKQKDAALEVAAFVFHQYAQNHMAKGTPESAMKGLTNLGLERVMLDALEAD